MDPLSGRPFAWYLRALTWFVYGCVLLVEVLLAIGFVLLLFGVDPTSGLVEFLYRSLGRALAPFRGLFPDIRLGLAEAAEVKPVVETAVLVAMIGYGIVALALHDLLAWLGEHLERREAPADGSPPPA